MFRKIEPPPDPEEMMTGVCGTCGWTVNIQRWQAHPPKGTSIRDGFDFGSFPDLWTTECQACKEQSKKIKKIGASGSKIYLMPKKKGENALRSEIPEG